MPTACPTWCDQEHRPHTDHNSAPAWLPLLDSGGDDHVDELEVCVDQHDQHDQHIDVVPTVNGRDHWLHPSEAEALAEALTLALRQARA